MTEKEKSLELAKIPENKVFPQIDNEIEKQNN
jgi:hypothetical protein